MSETPGHRGPALGLPDGGDGGDGSRWLPLHVTASLVGGYRWIEQCLFEVLGRAAAQATRPGLRVHLDAQAARHAWHASLWADRLPVRDGVSADELTVAPAAAARILGVLDGVESDTMSLVAGLYRVVLPRLVTGYRSHLAVAAPVSDGPVIRALGLVLSDEVEDWNGGERLIQGLLTRPDDVARAAALVTELESAVVEAGPSGGLTGWRA